MQPGFPISSTMRLGDHQGWGTKGGLGNSAGLTLRCLATADGAECQGMPFDTLDQKPCLYLGTSS